MFNLTPVVKNLLILNVGLYIITMLFPKEVQLSLYKYIDIVTYKLSLHNPYSESFQPYQILTNMFMHDGFTHLLFNMLWLVFMGPNIERLLGDKRFLTFYMVCGLGATILYMATQHFMFGNPPYMLLGASGAVSGVMIATAMFFPNSQIIMFPIPIPIRLKYFVIGYAALELFNGLSSADTGIAHFAHLGGMLIGFIMIKMWRINTSPW